MWNLSGMLKLLHPAAPVMMNLSDGFLKNIFWVFVSLFLFILLCLTSSVVALVPLVSKNDKS